MKKILAFVAVGGLLGMILGTWLGPKAISWHASPGVPSPVDCTAAIDVAMTRLIWTQSISGGVGALLLVIAGSLVARSLHARAERKAAAKAAAPPPPAQI